MNFEILYNFRLVFFRRVRKNCQKRLLSSSCLFIRPPVFMEQLGSHWTDFHEIWYLSIFRKFVEKIKVSLKSDKNKGYFTWRPIHIYIYIYIYHVKRIRHIVLSYVVYPTSPYFSTLSYKQHNFWKKKSNAHKIVRWFSLQLLSVTSPILKRIQQIIIIYIHGSPCKVPVILVRF